MERGMKLWKLEKTVAINEIYTSVDTERIFLLNTFLFV